MMSVHTAKSSTKGKTFSCETLDQPNKIKHILETPSSWDVFINHCGRDTKKSFSGLFHERLTHCNVSSFLDERSIKPGESIPERIKFAIKGCKVAVVVFSKGYIDSYWCLYELLMIKKMKKGIVPIFWDVEPSSLLIEHDDKRFKPKELEKIRQALREARDIAGLKFDTTTGDWTQILKSATDAVMKNLLEVEPDEHTFKFPFSSILKEVRN